MPALYTVQTRTDPGCVREINEDAVSTVLDWRERLELDDRILQQRGHLFALADGMGGHAAGEIASELAIRTLFETYYEREQEDASPQQLLARAIAAANEAICAEAEKRPDHAGLGTTLVAAVLRGRELLIANVGDSRAYLFHNRELKQITRDHSWVAEQVAAEVITVEEAMRHPYRNVITRSLGPERNPNPDFYRQTVHYGDRLLLCSDGLSNMVRHEEMAKLLHAYASDEAADRLLELACERGAPDNVSLVLVEFLMAQPQKKRKTRLLLVLSLVVLLLLALLVREFFVTMTAPPTPTPANEPPAAAAGAALTPIAPPGATIEPTLADPIRVGVIRQETDGEDNSIAPPREDYVFFIRGVVASIRPSSNGREMVLPYKTRSGAVFRYTVLLREGWTSDDAPPQIGATITLVARPVDETDLTGDIALEPLLLLAAESATGERPILWLKDGDPEPWEIPREYWMYSVYGPGGGDGLPLSTPPGLEGSPIVLRSNLFLDPERGDLMFIAPTSPVYEWSESANAYILAAEQPPEPPFSPSPFMSPPEPIR